MAGIVGKDTGTPVRGGALRARPAEANQTAARPGGMRAGRGGAGSAKRNGPGGRDRRARVGIEREGAD